MINNSKTYNTITSEPLEYLICTYGKGYALGFKGDKKYIDMAYNLFYNFDCSKHESKLISINDNLAYIHITMERIKNSLSLYFYVNILHNQEVPSEGVWDEEREEYNIIRDEELARKMADEMTEQFLSSHVKISCFLPPVDKINDSEFSMSTRESR